MYATDPNYGSNLISLMLRYDLYRYGTAGQAQPAHGPAGPPGSGQCHHPRRRRRALGGPRAHGVRGPAYRQPAADPDAQARADPDGQPAADPDGQPGADPDGQPAADPDGQPAADPDGQPAADPDGQPAADPDGQPAADRTASPEPTRTASPQPTRTASPQPTRTASPQPTRTRQPAARRRTASPQPSRTASPQPSRDGQSRSRGGRPAPRRRHRRHAVQRPAATPSGSPAQPDIPGVTTQSESDTRDDVRGPVRAGGPLRAGGRVRIRKPDDVCGPLRAGGPLRARGLVRGSPACVRPACATAVCPIPVCASPPGARLDALRHRPPARPPARSGPGPAPARATLVSARRYQPQIPRSVLNSFVETAKGPLVSEESFYRDVASFHGISWELLAACDWMQCDARPKRSPVYGEKLGTMNADGTVYTSKSAALARCASDLVTLAHGVYGIDLTSRAPLSVRDLANAFAAFRWGRALKDHDFSAMKFPYSVAGLTENHLGLRWPEFAPPNSGDRPRGRFHRRFGAVPIVLSLDYPATV